MQWSTWKTRFLETSLEGLFWTPSNRISYCTNIVKTSCSQLPARFGIFCLLVEIIYWPCSLKFVYPMINLAFLGIIVKVKLTAKFCYPRFEWFCLQISDTKFLPLFSKALWLRINSSYCILFSNLKQKKDHIIISRVISNHMGSIYIETSCIYIYIYI